jgi:hypothetical protein
MRITLEPDRDGEQLTKGPTIAQPGDPPAQDKIVIHGVINCAIAGDSESPGGGTMPIRFSRGDLSTIIAAMRSLIVHLEHQYHRLVTRGIVKELLEPKPKPEQTAKTVETPVDGRAQ